MPADAARPGGAAYPGVPELNPSLFRSRLAGALLGLLTGAVLAAKPTAELPLMDMTPRPHQHQRQTMDMQALMTVRIEPRADATDEERARAQQAQAAMPMTMKMRLQQTMRTGGLGADGWMPLTLDHRTMDLSMTTATGVPVPIPTAKTGSMTITARLQPQDLRFELDTVQGQQPLDDSLKPMMNTLMNQLLGMTKAMRGKNLVVGESFDMPLDAALPMPGPGPNGGQLKGQIRYTLTRLDKGVAYFDAVMTLDMNASVASSAGASAPAALPVNMTAQGGGQGKFSMRLADRLALTSDMTLQTQMTINAPNGDVVRMDMDMTMTGRGESLKPVAAKR